MNDNNLVVINTDNLEVPSESTNLFESRENVTSLSNSGILVSILVIAYNRLDKTKNCIDSILKYTDNVDYELVLVDSGSKDGTVEYFKSINYKNKKIIKITKNLQLPFAIIQGTKYCIGKYIAFLNNDMVVTQNWISNILKCFSSDNRIGMVCTTSLNVSNYQSADITFNTLDEMQQKAKLYNVSNPQKWHERLRLMTVGAVYKRECIEICGNWDYGFYHDFSDDDLTFHIRRAGYKTILCKDVFVHHDHDFNTMDSATYLKYQQSIEKGRENFKIKYYGIDAWKDVNNFEYNMLSMLAAPKHHAIDVLGIDVKCGTPILEIKNELKKYNVFDTYLSSFTEEAKYYVDLKTICEGDVQVDRIDYISEHFTRNSFDYILLGKSLNLYSEPLKVLTNVFDLVKDDGQVLLKLRNVNDITTLLNILGNNSMYDTEYPVNWTVDDLSNWINKLGFNINKIICECYDLNEDSIKNIETFCKSNNINEEHKTRIMTKDYVMSISKL